MEQRGNILCVGCRSGDRGQVGKAQELGFELVKSEMPVTHLRADVD